MVRSLADRTFQLRAQPLGPAHRGDRQHEVAHGPEDLALGDEELVAELEVDDDGLQCGHEAQDLEAVEDRELIAVPEVQRHRARRPRDAPEPLEAREDGITLEAEGQGRQLGEPLEVFEPR